MVTPQVEVTRKDTLRLLETEWKLFPICVPSYKRWDRKENKTLVKAIEPYESLRNNTHVFVRAEQEQAYKENYPWADIVVLPEVNGLAGTRQYIQDYALDVLNTPYFIDMDDDIELIHYVFHKDGEGKDGLSLVADTNCEQSLRYACAMATMAFERDNCVIGNMHRRRFANTGDSKNFPSQIGYQVNKGSTPRQVVFTNAKKLRELGITRNLAFDETGDDIGFVAEIAKRGLNMFQIRSLAYGFVDDALNSVIRNDENRRRLAQQEYDLLKQYPIVDYLRISQTFEDGSYRFSDIDYRKYRKQYGLEGTTIMVTEFEEWAKNHSDLLLEKH